jgi:tRNA (guanine-N7-)-methyltransferase
MEELAANGQAWWNPLEISLGSLSQPADLRSLFGNDHPINLEIGCGKGRFLITQALTDESQNWLGIESRRKFFRMMLRRVSRRNMPNVRLYCGDALYFIASYIPDASLRSLHIYFPDPWPKTRHHKRRVFRPEAAADWSRVLVSGGQLHVATDHPDLAELASNVIRDSLGWERVHTWEHLPCLEEARTNYEVKWLEMGRTVYEIRATCQ